MKYLLPLIAIMCSLATSAQNSQKTKRSKQLWIGLNLSPNYNFRTLANNGGDDFAPVIIRDRNANEQGRMGYVAGLSLFTNLNKHLGVEAGIFYANRSYQTKLSDLHFASPDPAAPTQARFIYKYRYIDIPVKLRFDAGHKRIRFTSSAGFAISFSADISDKVIYIYSDGRTEKRNQSSHFRYNSINISPVISAGAQYQLNKKTFLRIEPTFQYGLLKTIDMPVTEHLWSAGVNAGIYLRFR